MMLSMRQHALLHWLRYDRPRAFVHDPQAYQIAEAMHWKYPNTTKILRALHTAELVTYGAKVPGDEHYVQRHKITDAGIMYLVSHR